MSGLFSNDMLRGQLALVTGASRGIGASIAATLAAAGATEQPGDERLDDGFGRCTMRREKGNFW